MLNPESREMLETRSAMTSAESGLLELELPSAMPRLATGADPEESSFVMGMEPEP